MPVTTDTDWDDPQIAQPRKQDWATWIVIVMLLGGAFVTLKQMIGPRLAHAGWTTDWEAAIPLSQRTNKPMLVLFTADWCPACQHFQQNTLAQNARQLESRFTLVKVDMTDRNGRGAQTAARLHINSVPTLVLFNAKGEMVDRLSGSIPGPYLMKWLDARTGRS